jgi:hypothetical protein
MKLCILSRIKHKCRTANFESVRVLCWYTCPFVISCKYPGILGMKLAHII